MQTIYYIIYYITIYRTVHHTSYIIYNIYIHHISHIISYILSYHILSSSSSSLLYHQYVIVIIINISSSYHHHHQCIIIINISSSSYHLHIIIVVMYDMSDLMRITVIVINSWAKYMYKCMCGVQDFVCNHNLSLYDCTHVWMPSYIQWCISTYIIVYINFLCTYICLCVHMLASMRSTHLCQKYTQRNIHIHTYKHNWYPSFTSLPLHNTLHDNE